MKNELNLLRNLFVNGFNNIIYVGADMKTEERENSYYLEAENDTDNNIIAVIVNRIDIKDHPELFIKEGCFQKKKGGKYYNYMEIPLWEEI